MYSECNIMMKKNKGVVMDAENKGVMTRSKLRALNKNKNDDGKGVVLQRGGGSKRRRGGGSKLGVVSASAVVKKKQKRKRKEKEMKVEVEVERGDMVKEDLDGVDFVDSFGLAGIGMNGDGNASVIDDDMMIGDGGGETEYGGVIAGEIGGVGANAEGVDDGGVIGGGDDEIIAEGDDVAHGGVAATAIAEGGVDGTAVVSAGEGAELGGDAAGGNDDRVIRESTPEHLIIRSDYITTPCSDLKGANDVADERPQPEVGGNSQQHMKLTTDLLLQDNSNYAPSMEKYNFDFENEKPLFGRYEWEKVQP